MMVSAGCAVRQIASDMDTDVHRAKHAGRHPQGLADVQIRDKSQGSCMSGPPSASFSTFYNTMMDEIIRSTMAQALAQGTIA